MSMVTPPLGHNPVTPPLLEGAGRSSRERGPGKLVSMGVGPCLHASEGKMCYLV